MIFKRFLSKKKPVARPEDQDALVQVAHTHEDPAARRDACRRINRLADLREVAGSDMDAGVREIARARYRHLLRGEEKGALPVPERLQEIDQLVDERLLAHLAREAGEAAVRQAAILKVNDDEVLAACALHDGMAGNRGTAVLRLQGKDALELVAKNIGKKDKSVYRIARQKLKEIAEREAQPARIREQCAELCDKLDRLGRFQSWVQDRALLDLLERQWTEIAPQAEPPWRERYEVLRERFLASYDAYRREHEAEIAAAEAREALRQECQALLEEFGGHAALTEEREIIALRDRVGARWEKLDALPEREQEQLERRYRGLLAEVSSQLEQLAIRRKNNRRLRKLLAGIENALEQSRPISEKQLRPQIDEAKGLLQAGSVDAELAAAVEAARARLDERLRKQKQHAEQRLAQIEEKLRELEAAIDAGELKQAEPLHQSLMAAVELAQASGLPRTGYSAVLERLNQLAPQVRDLQQWRKWGADQHRLGLCETMEGLVTADLGLEALALRLRDLQMEWKGLDKTGSPVNHPLWERFHAASDRVYERCRPYFEQQAAERETNRRQREEVCQEIEDFLDKVDWQRMDWKKAIRAEREMRKTWAALGPVDAHARKALERRFHNGIKRLDAHLAQERAHNQALKRDLIARIEALDKEADLPTAIQEAKRLQALWQTTVPARQQEENRLWQRFRAACDAVFARRRERQEAQVAELTANLEQREAICSEAEALARAELEAHDLAAMLGELDKRWRDAEALPVPRQALGPLAQRWRAANQRAQRRRQERLEAQRQQALDLLARQAALCERLERALEAGDDAFDPAAVEREWDSLPAQRDEALQAAIAERFGAAAAALAGAPGTSDDPSEQFAANARKRAELCLQLEILAQVDSPPELAKERLAMQVARLKEHMSDGERDPLESASRLLQQWYLCGSAPAGETAAMETRFAQARKALERAERETEAA